MYKFQIKPSVYEFEKMTNFLETFNVSTNDTIFTEKFFYNKYMKGKVNCNFIFQDDYGLGEPSDIIIDKILNDLNGKEIDRIIGIGGGTILDITKLLAIKNATTTEDIFEDKIPLMRDKSLILIPTTCGTGGEMTCVSVVGITKMGTKIGKRIEVNFADYAVLIEELLDSIPAETFSYSSADALIHAMEIFVAPTGNPYNDVFCESAIRIILTNYKKLLEEGIDSRFKYIDQFLRASTFSGIALSNTTCGAVHALAMHFGNVHNVPHGESNIRFLTSVFKKYADLSPTGKLQDLAFIIRESLNIETKNVSEIFNALEQFIHQLIPKKKIREYGVERVNLEKYVDKVIDSQQRLLQNNFIPLSKDDLLDIYINAY